MKYLTVKEFREKGYLQELNRQFLHPLGLSLAIMIDEETGKETFGNIWDCREDPEGIIFDLKNSNMNRLENFIRKIDFVKNERLKFLDTRNTLFNTKDGIEPVMIPVLTSGCD